MSTLTTTAESPPKSSLDSSASQTYVDADEEKAFLPATTSSPPQPAHLTPKFWLSAAINTTATAGIIFINKHIFTHPRLRHAQVSFAAFHFSLTTALLYLLSQPPPYGPHLFPRKRVPLLRIAPLAAGMILNVVLPNASLAFSSIQSYQVMRVLVTPVVCALNFLLLRERTPKKAVMALIPVCLGVAVLSYSDVGGTDKTTGMLGVFFATAGVLATAAYTVGIKRYHAVLECTSMQLLLNQAPVSMAMMAYLIPVVDDVTVWGGVEGRVWGWIGASGLLACLITVTQFIIIHEAGPVTSTVVGHFKTCLVIVLSWVVGGRGQLAVGSVVGVAMALGGVVAYSVVMHKLQERR